MVREEIEFGGLVPEQVDVTSIDVVVEPLLGDSKLLSDFSDREVACWTTRVSRGTFQQFVPSDQKQRPEPPKPPRKPAPQALARPADGPQE